MDTSVTHDSRREFLKQLSVCLAIPGLSAFSAVSTLGAHGARESIACCSHPALFPLCTVHSQVLSLQAMRNGRRCFGQVLSDPTPKDMSRCVTPTSACC